MKSLSALILTVFYVSISFATPLVTNDTAPCRDYFKELDVALTPLEQVRQDFIQGSWSTQDANIANWAFQADGTLFVIRKAGKEYQVEKAAWTVQHHHTATILYLREPDQQTERRYLIEQHCDGINLENIDSEELLQLQYQKGNEQRYKSILASVRGHWEHTLPSEVIASIPAFTATGSSTPVGAKILLDLRADGTFVQTLFCASQAIRETTFGKWVLSPNGQFLIVDAQDDSSQIRCLPIQYLEYDELVLSQLLPAGYTEQMNHSFYFNKS